MESQDPNRDLERRSVPTLLQLSALHGKNHNGIFLSILLSLFQGCRELWEERRWKMNYLCTDCCAVDV